MKKRRILISVTDKTGLEKFEALTGPRWEIISTGGTAYRLSELGIPCTLVEDVTGFPEMMDGRVKTLHPDIFAGILADRSKPEHMDAIKEQGIEPIDMVVVNLYNFEGKPGIENIDIGGPSLIRAAAKNGNHVVPVVDPADYDSIIKEFSHNEVLSMKTKLTMVMKAFNYTSRYDTAIAHWLHLVSIRDESLWD